MAKDKEKRAERLATAEKAVNLGTNALDSVGGFVRGIITAKNTETINENKSVAIPWGAIFGVLGGLLVVGLIVKLLK